MPTVDKPSLNDATMAQLKRVPQIGQTLAKRIVQHSPFHEWAEVERLFSIGPVRMNNLKLVFVLEETIRDAKENETKDKREEPESIVGVGDKAKQDAALDDERKQQEQEVALACGSSGTEATEAQPQAKT